MKPLSKSHWQFDTSRPVDEVTLGGLLELATSRAPDNTALIEGTLDRKTRYSRSYAQLFDDAVACAQALLTRVDPGDHVAVWAPNSGSWVVLEFGAALAGTPLVTINPALKESEVRAALAASRACLLVHAESFRGDNLTEVVTRLRLALPSLRTTVPMSSFDDFLHNSSKRALPAVTPDDPALILFTSGTTGAPKAAMIRHRAVANNARFCAERAGFSGGSWLNPLPLFHVGGCVNAVIGPVWSSGTHVLMELFDPGLAIDLAQTTQPDLFGSVPTMILALMDHPEFNADKFASVKTILSGGSTVPMDLCRRIEGVLDCRFSIVYGQTESTSVISQVRPDDSYEDKASTIGQALPQVECKVIDRRSGETVPIGGQGELCVRGYQTMIGYLDNQAATSETIDDEGWLHTGDLAEMDDRGYMKIVGRIKEVIIRGGENITPREIEEVVLTIPRVAEVVVVGKPDPMWGEIVVGVVRPTGDLPAPSSEELTTLCRQSLARHKVPVEWFTVDSFPVTASGKVQRFLVQRGIVEEALERLP